MTSTICLWPIFAALCKVLLFCGVPVAPEAFNPITSMQHEFIKNYLAQGYDKLDNFSDKELQSWASNDVDYLNNILKKEGFSIQLKPFGDPYAFGVVSIFDVMVKWLEQGTKSTIYVRDTNYPAVKMAQGFSAYSSSGHPYPVVCLKTKSGDLIWLTIADKPLKGFDLLARVQQIRQNIACSTIYYDDLIFPMVDCDDEPDISWLLGLKLLSVDYQIEQALQQTKFKMNEQGAHVKSAVAFEMVPKCLNYMHTSLVIDEPFYLWIERSSEICPVLAGYFDVDCWKEPANLDS